MSDESCSSANMIFFRRVISENTTFFPLEWSWRSRFIFVLTSLWMEYFTGTGLLFLILHKVIVLNLLKIFVFDMVNIAFLINHISPPMKSALPSDRAENFRAGHLLDASGERAIFSNRSLIGRQR